jgi:ribonuclease BN (tRNA processing enzyme)
VRVRFLGSGDVVGSGGRMQTCILVEAGTGSFLIDCGASSMIAMRRFEVLSNDIGLILLSHLHGDHFGGIPFFVLDAQLVSKRTDPLVVAGPPGTARRLEQVMETLFPGLSRVEQRFELQTVELEPGRPHAVGGLTVTPYEVDHPSGAPAFALRVEADGRVLTYTGDTAWTDALIPAATGADLLIAEAYYYEKRIPYHLDYRTLREHMPELQAARVVVTHMSQDMLDRLATLDCEAAEDGKVIEVS